MSEETNAEIFEEEDNNVAIINSLLSEFQDHRDAVMSMVTDIEKLQANMEKLIPDKLDARYIRFFEEKVKTVTEFFKTLLEMRKEVQKSLKDEIEIRRKINLDSKGISIEEMIDVRGVAKTIESFKVSKLHLKKEEIEKSQRETQEIAKEVEY